MSLNTNMHVTYVQARTLLEAVRYQLYVDTSGDDRAQLLGCETMLVAALGRIRDLEARRAGV